MLETPHVAVGAAIATKVINPFIAIPLALGSHFVLDKIPHWNPHFYTETQKNGRPNNKSTLFAITDVLIALVLGSVIAYSALPDINRALIILAASLASVLPDLSKAPFYFLKVKTGILKKWVDFERTLQVEISFVPGMLVQIAVVSLSVLWIYN